MPHDTLPDGTDVRAGAAADAGSTGAGRQPPRSLRRAVLLLVAAAGAVVVTSVASMVRECWGGAPLTPYVAPLYWLGYDQGFVRRALPGGLTRLLTDGQDPGYLEAALVGVGLSALAVLAILLLAAMLARRAGSPPAVAAVAAAVIASPLGLSLYARDLGRPDAVGVVVLVVLAAAPWRRLPLAATALGIALLTTAAVAAEELLAAFVVPVALVALRSARAGRRPGWTAAVTLAPCLLVALLSIVLAVPAAVLDRATAAARAAGVPPAVPLVPGRGDHDAVSRLRYGLVENAQTYYGVTTPAGVLAATLLCCALYLLVVVLVWRLLGGAVRDPAFGRVATLGALAALALSAAGIDYRRWWALAAVTVLSLLLGLTEGRDRRPMAVGGGMVVALLALAVAGAGLQALPLWPVGSLAELRTRMLG